jgi:GNAT superfamily N-acetyltransferase
MEDIEVTDKAEDAQVIRQKLNEYNCQFVKPDNHEKLCLIVRRKNEIIGGLIGGTYWNWMYIELFWVDKKERNSGLGSKILTMAEGMAVGRGCGNAHLETHDFQSLGFYEKRGYVIFGELADLPEGHTKYYLRKRLIG